MISGDGFVPITAIFYAVFHPIQGTKIVHQVPDGSIASSLDPRPDDDALFNFDTVKNYIIPKAPLCNQLVSFKINEYRVLGYPVNIEASSYSRNSFSFNFCFVLPYSSDKTPYESAVTRMGKMFRALEEQSHLLSRLDRDQAFFSGSAPQRLQTQPLQTPGLSKIQKFSLSSIESLIHQIYQDLNNYSECCIPIDSANSVDIKLFPMLPPPVNLKAYQVPIPTVKLGQLMDVIWDPTMVKLLPYIDGLNSVKRISDLAGADYLLTKQCIQHLMHYQCIILVDIFQFGSIYAPTNHIGLFLRPNGMAEECQSYIITSNNSDDSYFSTQSATPATASHVGTPRSHKNQPYQTNQHSNHSNSQNQNFQNSQSSARHPNPSSNANSNLANSNPNSNLANSNPAFNSNHFPFDESASPHTRAMTPGRFPGQIKIPSKATLFFLYRSLNQGQTLKEWCIQHQKALVNIDVRRFINFGLVRGLIYRVHSYPILQWVTQSLETGGDGNSSLEAAMARLRKSVKKKEAQKSVLKSAVMESSLTTGKKARTVSFNYVKRSSAGRSTRSGSLLDEPVDYGQDVFSSTSESESDGESESESEREENEVLLKLTKLVRGSQHFDSICTELQIPRLEVEALLDKLGAHSIINA